MNSGWRPEGRRDLSDMGRFVCDQIFHTISVRLQRFKTGLMDGSIVYDSVPTQAKKSLARERMRALWNI